MKSAFLTPGARLRMPGDADPSKEIILQVVDIPDSDRGPAEYFHGRKAELAAFGKVCRQVRAKNGGTIFLVQGAPGAGKTALLHECAKRAEKTGWRVARITNHALYNPGKLADFLGITYATKTTVTDHKERGGGLRYVFNLFGSRTKGKTTDFTGLSVDRIIYKAAKSHGLLLVLDEVQNLKTYHGREPDTDIETNLDLIHNGNLGVPVILLAGGLGISQRVLESFGISRFMRNCVVYLGRLDPVSERAVIEDWLVKAGGAKDDPAKLDRWIETIAAEAYGWPQHILAYAPPSAKYVRRNHGALTDEVPEAVMEVGRATREDYYRGRLDGIEPEHFLALGGLVQQKGKHARLTKSELVVLFARHATPKEAEAVFQQVLHKGVIAHSGPVHYAVPIPSMEDWLVAAHEKYGPAVLPAPPTEVVPE